MIEKIREEMKIALIALAITSIALCQVEGEEKGQQPLRVETDYGGDPSNVSTNELVLNRRDGTTEYLTKNGFMERVPRLSHDNSLLAFLRRIDSNHDGKVNWDDEVELWTMRLEDRLETRLVKNLSNPSQATWHSAKLVMAFIATNPEGDRGLYSYDLSTNSIARLSDEANSWPAWSPGGDFIAFYDDGNRVQVFSVADRRGKVLSGDVGNGWALYWTSGNRLVFTDEAKGWQIYNPGADQIELLKEKERKDLTFIDQEEFNWASTHAGQRDAANPAKPDGS